MLVRTSCQYAPMFIDRCVCMKSIGECLCGASPLLLAGDTTQLSSVALLG